MRMFYGVLKEIKNCRLKHIGNIILCIAFGTRSSTCQTSVEYLTDLVEDVVEVAFIQICQI